MVKEITNELAPNLLGINAMNPFDRHNSSSRRQMFGSHLSQTLTLLNGTEKRIQSGMEREYGKYTFSVKMPVDGKILKIIRRYPPTLSFDAIKHNPETLLIYEDVATKQIGHISLVDHFSNHQYFGFNYKPTDALKNLSIGSYISKGTILLDSPAVDKQGNYNYGIECNVAFMTHPAASEDGFVVSESLLKTFKFDTFETRVVEWGSKHFTLNAYGDDTNFKAFPDVGEFVREDGILIALRSYDEGLAVVEQSLRGLRRIDHTFDKKVYAPGGGQIVDIRVQHDLQADTDDAAFDMDKQAEKYDTARRVYYAEIIKFWKEMKREKGYEPNFTPAFHRLLVEAQVVLDNDKQRIVKTYRNTPVDTWRVTFIIRNTITPNKGFKLTDSSGGKGVIVAVLPDSHMPVDKAGNRADCIIDPNSTISRSNPGRKYEHYFNAAARDVSIHLREYLGTTDVVNHKEQVMSLVKNNITLARKAWNYLTGFYNLVSSTMHEGFAPYAGDVDNDVAINHLTEVSKNGIYLHVPTNNKRDDVEVVTEIEKQYPPVYGPVMYVGYNGKLVTTRKPVRIASMYIIILEKIADGWMAVGTGKRQHYGVLAPITNLDKYSQPTRQQAVRGLGEAEMRIVISFAGVVAGVELLDRNNNPLTHEHMLGNIYAADKPTDIDKVVNRNEIPLGGSKPLAYVNHIMACAGIRYVYKKHVPDYGVINA